MNNAGAMAIEERIIAKMVFRIAKLIGELPLPIGVEELPTNDLIKSIESGIIPLCGLSLVYVLKYIVVQIETLTKTEEVTERNELTIIYFLSLFTTCCQHKWDFIKKNFKNIQGTSEIGKIRLEEKQELIRPPPFDDRLARECYSKITPLITKPQTFFQEKIQMAASKSLFLLSVYNYDSIIGNLTQHMLPHSNPSEEDITVQLTLLQYLNNDANQLSELLKKVDSATQTYKKDKVQFLLAKVLRKAIWNWIDNYPIQFVSLCQGSLRLQCNPEQVFDVFSSWSGGSSKRDRIFWPTQTMLLLLCPEIMRKVAKGDTAREQFIEHLKKGIKGKKPETAAICFVDICKAATFVSANEKGNSSRIIVNQVEKDLKEKLFNPAQPFKREDGQVDEDLMVDCLISLFMLTPDKIVNSLFQEFVTSAAHPILKRVLVKTLLRIAHEGASLPWNPTITDVYATHAGNLRQLFQEFKDSGQNYLIAMATTGKKAEKIIEKSKIDLDILITLIELFAVSPALALFPVPGQDSTLETRDLITGLCECLALFEVPDLHDTAVKALLTLHAPQNIIYWDRENTTDAFWIISSTAGRDISSHLIKNIRWDFYEVKKMISVVHQLLTSRIQFLEANPNMNPTIASAQLRSQSSSIMETALLIHLPSIDLEIASLSAQCVGFLCTEVDHIRAFIKQNENAIIPNYNAYAQLSNAANVITGREVQQKGIRKVLRQVETSTNGNYTAWYKLYDRFQLFTQAIIYNIEQENEVVKEKEKTTSRSRGKKAAATPTDHDEQKFPDISRMLFERPQDVLQQWNHYLNFLCAMAAVSKGKTVPRIDKGVEISVEITEEFLCAIVQYLVHDSVNIQTVVKNAAGTSLSPAVYPSFFRMVSDQISKLQGSAQSAETNAADIRFVDQVILVLRGIIESNSDANNLALLSDIEELIVNMIRFVRQQILTSSSLQTKHKLAGLIEALMYKSKYIPFKNEYKFRSQLVDSIMEWTSEFSAKASAVADLEQVNIKKIIKDLDLQVMMSISALLKNLPLQGKDDEAKSEAFSKLFSFFTRLLDRCKKEPATVNSKVSTVTIEALSFLVAANIEHGLDYFKEMGYHENNETRSAFLDVLSNILKQGAEFDVTEEDGVDKYYKLAEIIFEPKLDAILTLCEVTPVTEADAIAQLACRIFEGNQCVLDLIKASIVYEVSRTEKANTLFRLNSFATKLMVQYCKLIGVDYLRTSVGPEIRSILSKKSAMEMDPAKLPAGQSVTENFENVKNSALRFLADIQKSIPECPGPFRDICYFLQQTVGAKFPGAEHTAIAGFMFLRFLCPAIIAPDGFRVIPTAIQDKDSRRSLVLVTKVLQNLANRVLFTKEPFMQCMNPFIEEKIPEIRSMFDLYATVPESPPMAQLNFSDEQREADMGALHFYLSQSSEKMAKAVATQKAAEQETDWFEKLTVLLSQLGEPPRPSTKKAAARPFTPSGGDNRHYEEFMKMNRKTETDFLKSRNFLIANGKTKKQIPLLYYITGNSHMDVEIDKLIFFMLKTAAPLFSKKYSIVIDLTGFTSQNAITTKMAAQMSKLLPSQAYDHLDAIYILHPSSAFKKYIKCISKYIGRAAKKIVLCSFVPQLEEYIDEKELYVPDSTKESESEIQSDFSPVTKVAMNKKTEVQLRIVKDSVHIISLKPHPIFASSCQLIDFIPISGIAKVMPGTKDNEVCMKLESGGQVITFISKVASQIGQQLNDSLERYKLTRPQSKSKKPFNPSDVPGTLLNMALLNLTSTNPSLRVGAYNLLAAACQTFSFNMESVLLAGSDIALARNCLPFVTRISRELSKVEPGLTLEVISEALGGLDDKNIFKLNILKYMKPWLYNLSQFAEEAKGEKMRDSLLSLIAATVRESRDNMPMLLSSIWKPIAKQESLLDCVMDCLFQFAVPSSRLDTKKVNCVEDIIITLATEKSQLVAGKIISLLLSLIHIPDKIPVDRLENHDNWLRIEICLRWLMSLTFGNLVSLNEFMPEVLHIIVMCFSFGDSLIRADSYSLFINLVHATFTARICHPKKTQLLRSSLAEFQSPSARVPFAVTGAGKNFDPYQSQEDRDMKIEKNINITMVENVAQNMLTLLTCCTPNDSCFGTQQHARWLSLTSAAAFTAYPAIQPRAVITLGVLAASPSLVSPELFSQLLGLLKEALHQSMDSNVNDLAIAVVKCLCHLYRHLSPWSKNYKSFFWLVITLIQVHDVALFTAALPLLDNVVKTLHESGHFQASGMASFCMNARKGGRLEPLLDKFDNMTGVNFDTSFSFAVSALMLKGLKSPSAKTATVRVLSTILRLCNESSPVKVLGYFAGLLPIKGDDDVELIGMLKHYNASGDPQTLCNKVMVPDKANASLLFYFLATILKNSDLEQEQLVIYKLFVKGIHYMPDVFPIVFEQIKEKISQVLANSQNPEILKTIHQINHEIYGRTLTASYSSASANQALQNLGYLGLKGSDQFNSKQKGAQIQIACSILDAMLEERE